MKKFVFAIACVVFLGASAGVQAMNLDNGKGGGDMPNEIWGHVGRFCEAQDLVQVSQANHRFCEIVQDLQDTVFAGMSLQEISQISPQVQTLYYNAFDGREELCLFVDVLVEKIKNLEKIDPLLSLEKILALGIDMHQAILLAQKIETCSIQSGLGGRSIVARENLEFCRQTIFQAICDCIQRVKDCVFVEKKDRKVRCVRFAAYLQMTRLFFIDAGDVAQEHLDDVTEQWRLTHLMIKDTYKISCDDLYQEVYKKLPERDFAWGAFMYSSFEEGCNGYYERFIFEWLIRSDLGNTVRYVCDRLVKKAIEFVQKACDYASKRGRLCIATDLAERSVDFDRHLSYAMHGLLMGRHFDTVRDWIARFEKKYIGDYTVNLALEHAAEKGKLDVVLFILENFDYENLEWFKERRQFQKEGLKRGYTTGVTGRWNRERDRQAKETIEKALVILKQKAETKKK